MYYVATRLADGAFLGFLTEEATTSAAPFFAAAVEDYVKAVAARVNPVKTAVKILERNKRP
jgi:hypothetical protein